MADAPPDVEALQEEVRRLERERDRLERAIVDGRRQLQYSRQMATLGSLVAGILHEIKTPVGAIGSMQDTLGRAVAKLRRALERAPSGEVEGDRGVQAALRAVEDANRVIGSASGRALEIVRRVRKFAHIDEGELQRADLHAELEDTLMLLHHQLKDRIEIVRSFGEIPAVNCYVGQLNQVFLNVLVNASQAIAGEGQIEVTTSAAPGEVRVAVRDTGEGIPPENLERIFDPGFTTKSAGVGTGIGLSICREILEAHRGRIEVDSQVGVGTTITIVVASDL